MAVKKKITNASLKQLTVAERRINDTEVSGFHALKFESGKVVYYLYYRINGKQANYKIGPASDLTPAQARDLAREKLGEVAKGQDVQENRKEKKRQTEIKKSLRLGIFLEKEYLPFLISRNPKTAQRLYKQMVSTFADYLDTSIPDISAFMMQKWVAKRKEDGRASATIAASFNALKGALSRAVEWGFIESHDLKKVKIPKEDNTRIRYLSVDEEKALLQAITDRNELIRTKRDSANNHRQVRGRDEMMDLKSVRFVDHIEPIILLAMHSGLRKGELFSLEWSDINLERRYLTVKGTNAKSKKSRVIPLNETALNLLEGWRSQNPDKRYVFTNGYDDLPITDIKKAWLNLLADAEIKNFRFHDLRHHFASKLVMAGVDLNTVRELLGHSDLKMTLRYAHLAPEHKAAAVGLIG
ncbi:site-specific integrase [Vibrio quintilis]|uniref:Tyrosine recombinase XerC n=1 Tax=Vibrio quintilis TaxID=1117707 RepID=A0A1M7YTU6_9VIBR|nr:site-specific integrase [Vibrio quintilis]SHO56077.1 Tyrosine recombinase XerC [Vibrio quintilis]